jgi:hypothetical protein
MKPQDGKSKTCHKMSWFVLLIFKLYSSKFVTINIDQ